MKKIAIDKKIIFTVILVIYILFLTNTFSLTPSVSKYIDTKDSAIIYDNNLYSIFIGDDPSLIEYVTSSTHDSLEYHLNMIPNQIGQSPDEDWYRIVGIPTGCTVSPKASNKTHLLESKNNYRNVRIDDEVEFDIACNPELLWNGKSYVLDIKVYEKVGNEPEFLYKYRRNIRPELPPIKVPMDLQKDIDISLNVYDELKKWLYEYVENEYIEDEWPLNKSYVDNYINVYKDNDFSYVLPGLSVSTILDDGKISKYHFEILENFMGYARTKDYILSGLPRKNMYFTTSDEEALRKAFTDYLGSNFYGYTDYEVELITKYLQAINVDIAYFIKTGYTGPNNTGSKSVKGLIRGNNQLSLSDQDDLLTLATNYFSQATQISDLKEQLTNLRDENPYYKNLISENTLNKFISNNEVINASNKANVLDYYIEFDEENNYYVILNIYVDNDKVYFTFSKILIADALNITFRNDNENKKLYVEITLKNYDEVDYQTKLKEIFDTFNLYFNLPNYTEETDYIEGTLNDLTINFKIVNMP